MCAIFESGCVWRKAFDDGGIWYFDEDAMKINEKWTRIIAWGLCVILAVALCGMVRIDRQRTAQRVAQLQQQANEIQKTDSEKQVKLAEIYAKYYTELNVPSMVCWGDAAMAGAKDRSLVISMEKTVNDNLFAPLTKTFSKALESEENTVPSVTIHNMGVTNEEMRQILVRAGVNTMEVGDWTQFPGDTDPVTIRLVDEEARENGGELRFAKQKDVSFGQV